MANFHIQTVHIPAKNIHLLRPVKYMLGLRTAGIYHIPCECGNVYVGQSGRTIGARIKEHRRHAHLNQTERSAVAEISLTTYHRIDFDRASKLGTATRYMDRLVIEALVIRLHPDNFNIDDGFDLSYAWCPSSKFSRLLTEQQRQIQDRRR
jgi:predicted GIY-YIG superfamily endonuclease